MLLNVPLMNEKNCCSPLSRTTCVKVKGRTEDLHTGLTMMAVARCRDATWLL